MEKSVSSISKTNDTKNESFYGKIPKYLCGLVNKTKPALKTIGTTVKKSQIFEDSLNTLTEIKSLKIKGKTFFRTFIQRC